MKTLDELLLDGLADMYDAEGRLVTALPRLAAAATHRELRNLLEQHLAETRTQVTRLEEVFQLLDRSAAGKKCEAMAGLLREAEQIASENQGEPTLDAALISAAQKIEHYEIASYGCLQAWAEVLGHEDVAEALQETLDEEEAADHQLSEVAETCNAQALGKSAQRLGGDKEDEEEEEPGDARRAPR